MLVCRTLVRWLVSQNKTAAVSRRETEAANSLRFLPQLGLEPITYPLGQGRLRLDMNPKIFQKGVVGGSQKTGKRPPWQIAAVRTGISEIGLARVSPG